jgi:hypothetical protein
MSKQRRHRSLTHRVIASGILTELAPDAAVLVALALIGVSVYRLCPDAVWAYAGLVVLVPAIVVLKQRASEKKHGASS